MVRHFLEHSAARLPRKVALVAEGRRYTYEELDRRANQVAHFLHSIGVQRGDRVGLVVRNSFEAVIGLFAVAKADAVFVILKSNTKGDKIGWILNNCRASALIADTSFPVAGISQIKDSVPTLKGVLSCEEQKKPEDGGGFLASFAEVFRSFPETVPPSRGIDLDLACLIYTSGTTGEPKGVMSDHANVAFATQSIITYLGNVESDVVLNVLPLSFDYGLYQLLMTFRFGGTLVLETSFAFPAAVLKKVEEERVTGFPGVPTVFSLLLPMDLSRFDLSSLRYITNTAAALPVRHIQEIRAKFPAATLFSMYGLTETKRTLYLPPEQLERRPDSVGIAIPGTEAWVESPEGRRLGPGETGELVVRGRHVMRGYWEAEQLTAHRFRPGPVPGERLCYTGDLFRQDSEGYFYFVGRNDDMIKCKGERISPKEIEGVLCNLAGVRQAAVVGVPDPLLGQAIKAFIVSDDPSLTEQQILGHCRKHLDDRRVPKCVEFRKSLPLSESGKIVKTGLM